MKVRTVWSMARVVPLDCLAYGLGKEFLKTNSQKEGVVALSSGLQYKVLRSGKAGGLTPKANSPCLCHYRGYLIDGTEFDSSYKRGEPTTFAPNQVIKGWTEAMQVT